MMAKMFAHTMNQTKTKEDASAEEQFRHRMGGVAQHIWFKETMFLRAIEQAISEPALEQIRKLAAASSLENPLQK